METWKIVFYVVLAVAFIGWLLYELVLSQRDAEHLPVLTLCVDTYDTGSFYIAVPSVEEAQKVMRALNFSHLHDVRVWDSANERVVASMNDNGVLV